MVMDEVFVYRSRDATNAEKTSPSGAVDGDFIEGQSALSPRSHTATGYHLDGLSLPRVQVCPPLSLPNYPLSQWQRAPHPSADARPVRHRSLLFGIGDIIAQQLIEKRGLRRHDVRSLCSCPSPPLTNTQFTHTIRMLSRR